MLDLGLPLFRLLAQMVYALPLFVQFFFSDLQLLTGAIENLFQLLALLLFFLVGHQLRIDFFLLVRKLGLQLGHLLDSVLLIGKSLLDDLLYAILTVVCLVLCVLGKFLEHRGKVGLFLLQVSYVALLLVVQLCEHVHISG